MSLDAATILSLTLISLNFRLRELWKEVTKVPEEDGEKVVDQFSDPDDMKCLWGSRIVVYVGVRTLSMT